MINLIVQWEKFSGPDAIGQHKIIFTMDESIDQGPFNPLAIKKGTQFRMILIEAGKEDEFLQETPEQTKARFFKHFHALITDIAKLLNIPATQYKDELKKTLINSHIIKESTTELTTEQLATEIAKLKKYKETLI